MNSKQENFIELLVLHNGACSVPSHSDLDLAGISFWHLKLVTKAKSSTPGMTDYRLFNYQTHYQQGEQKKAEKI